MSIISTIVTAINTNYANNVFTDGKYATKRIVGLAMAYPEKKGKDTLIKIVPAVYSTDANGSGNIIDLDNSKSLIIYHKLNDAAYSLIQDGAKGDGYLQQWIINITMTVAALRDITLMQPDDLNEKIIGNLPSGIANITGINKCFIAPVSTDFDFISILRKEYASVDYFLKPNQMLFQLKYKVTATVNPHCLL